MSSTMHLRPFVLIMGLALLLSALAADGAFQYQRYYNMSGGYGDLHPAFIQPRAVYADSGGLLYVSDYGSKAVWVIDGNDSAVSRIPSGSANLLERPANMVKDGGVLYIADEGKGNVVAFMGSGISTNVGPAISAQRQPWGVAVENQTMWLVEDWRDQVMGYNLQTGLLRDVFFGSGAGSSQLNQPKDIASDASHFYIADSGNNRIQVYDKSWKYLDSIGTGRGGLSLSGPVSVALDNAGRMYVADSNNIRVAVFSQDGYVLGTLGGTDGGAPGLLSASSVAVAGNTLYVLDDKAAKVYAYGMNWTAGVPQVLADLDALNRTISAHQTQVLDVMDRISLSHAPFGASRSLAQAQSLAQAGQYLEASRKIAAAREELDSVRLQQLQALRAEMQKSLDSFWAAILPDKSLKLDNETAYQLVVVQNRIQTAQENLNADDYSGAADVVLSLQTDLPALQQRVSAWRASQGQGTGPVVDTGGQNPMKSALRGQAANLKARLALMQIDLNALGMNGTGDAYGVLIDSGSSLADVGAYEDANRTLQTASAKLDDLQTQISDYQNRSALSSGVAQTLGSVWARVNISSIAWQAAGISGAPVAAKLAQAQDLLASNPQAALQLIREANETANLQDAQVQGKGSVLGWVGLLVGAVAVVAIGAWILFRSRPKNRKGL